MMRLLLRSEFITMPWKNGGGETIEVMAYPQGAGLSDFEWRISMARVQTDGPFSVFPDIDRQLAVLDGKGMTLQVGDNAPCLLTPLSNAYSFAGDTPTTATLSDGPITDLNVMVRRGVWRAAVARHVIEARSSLAIAEETVILLSVSGSFACNGHTDQITVNQGDGVMMDQTDGPVVLVPKSQCVFWQISLFPVA